MNAASTGRRKLGVVLCGGMVLWVLCVGTRAVEGAANRALKIDGPAQFVEVPNWAVFRGGTNITVEAWLHVPDKVRELPSEPITAIAQLRTDADPLFALRLELPFFVFGLNDQPTGGLKMVSLDAVHLDHWMHVAATFDGHWARFFLNGRRDREVGYVGPPLLFQKSDFPFLIGKEGLPGTERGWLGQIDEVRIWNRSLNEDEIRSRMWVRLSGKEPGLVGYWNFDSGDAADSSVQANNGSIKGNAAIVESSLFLADLPRLELIASAPQQPIELLLTTQEGIDYTFQAAGDLLVWEDLGTVRGTGSSFRFFDFSSTAFSQRFYRVMFDVFAAP